MEPQLVEVSPGDGAALGGRPDLIQALEAGKVLHLPASGFTLLSAEQQLLSPDVRSPKSRNISLGVDGALKGGAADAAIQQGLVTLLTRYRHFSLDLIQSLFPSYSPNLRLAPTSFRPMNVETRTQSWRADDGRLHVDAFPTRPTYGERILRVFTNVNPVGAPRVWRVGERFDAVARRFVPTAKPYRLWQAKALNALNLTKSLRSEYDHLMLQLHDGMKRDDSYQQDVAQVEVRFMPGASWICFSDHASHAAMSGQYLLEQTLYLPPGTESDAASSPMAILTRLKGRPLVGAGHGRAL